MTQPLFTGLQDRGAGVLAHPTSFPSRQGVGSLGAGARAFLDFIAASGLGWWQVCPLGPTGYGDSPYQCFSSFAGNPYLIDLETLTAARLLDEGDLAPLRRLSTQRVEFGYLWEHFHPALAQAWRNAKANPALLDTVGDLQSFRKENAAWLDDYALFMALKKHFGGASWHKWPHNARSYAIAIKTDWPECVTDDARAIAFQQFLFFSQWKLLRKHAARLGVRILGDIPIFVAPDSADVWANPELFKLDAGGTPLHVAGVPPDYFSPAGQLWGNPLYDWVALKKDSYRWWLRRLASALALCDAVRIDHFRGFHDYWSIRGGAADAREGEWLPGPGLDFFKTVRQKLGDAALIAEDLGELSPGVHALRKAAGLPGMAVLQFAFGGDASNAYLPHNHNCDTVIYPGTHDNNTTRGWYAEAPEAERDFFRRYLGSAGDAPQWDFIRASFISPAALAVFPFQDILGVGAEARFNSPGTSSGNWQWRFTGEDLSAALAFHAPNLRKLARVSGRGNPS